MKVMTCQQLGGPWYRQVKRDFAALPEVSDELNTRVSRA